MTANESTSGEGKSADGQQRASVGAKVPQEVKDELDRRAFQRSEPGEVVPVSVLIREALADYLGIERSEVSLEE